MLVDFDQMPPHARVWIYMADRPITAADMGRIDSVLTAFTTAWTAHGAPLRSSYRVVQDRFVLLTVDDRAHGPSGCSIDHSVNVMKGLGEGTGINFFDRSLVPFSIGDEVVLLRLGELKQKYGSGVWNGRTLTFNIMAATLGEFNDRWVLPAEDTWLKRYVEPSRQDSLAG